MHPGHVQLSSLIRRVEEEKLDRIESGGETYRVERKPSPGISLRLSALDATGEPTGVTVTQYVAVSEPAADHPVGVPFVEGTPMISWEDATEPDTQWISWEPAGDGSLAEWKASAKQRMQDVQPSPEAGPDRAQRLRELAGIPSGASSEEVRRRMTEFALEMRDVMAEGDREPKSEPEDARRRQVREWLTASHRHWDTDRLAQFLSVMSPPPGQIAALEKIARVVARATFADGWQLAEEVPEMPGFATTSLYRFARNDRERRLMIVRMGPTGHVQFNEGPGEGDG